MKVPKPHFLLFSESSRTQREGQWRFVLQSIDGADQFEATDAEPAAQGERLELLAVVRGLEALPGPSQVTLITPSKYVNRGLSYGLTEWRSNGWQWEHFGEMVPVKNRDLWQRIDRALEFHQVECRTWRFDLPQNEVTPQKKTEPVEAPRTASPARRWTVGMRTLRMLVTFRRWLGGRREAAGLGLGQFGTRLVPLPWLQ